MDSKKKKVMDMSILGPAEAYLLHELSQYLTLNSLTLGTYLQDIRDVKTKSSTKTIQVINAEDLFDQVYSNDIAQRMEEMDQARLELNIKKCLSVDATKYPELIMVRKLEKAIQRLHDTPTMIEMANKFKESLTSAKEE